MWTPTTRQQHSRPVTRYQTDLTDAEWRVIAPHLPKPCATGRPRAWPMREIVNGIFYVMRAGCPWRLLPNDLPPWGTSLEVFCQPSIAPDPREEPLDDPTPRVNGEADLIGVLAHDLDRDQRCRGDLFPGISAVGEDALDEREDAPRDSQKRSDLPLVRRLA
jgi:Putative transposase of IS4/5 family (DUF4096)